jgi:hypothetical protein
VRGRGRQREEERASLAQLAFHPDLSTVSRHDALGDEETKSGVPFDGTVTLADARQSPAVRPGARSLRDGKG